MGTFKIEGGHVLSGEIVPQGAKNEALQVICATLLTSESVKISNVPNILDVNKLIDLLIAMGVKVTRHGNGVYTFKADDVNLDYLESDAFRADGSALRGSIMILGPLLARFGKVYMQSPVAIRLVAVVWILILLASKNLGQNSIIVSRRISIRWKLKGLKVLTFIWKRLL